MATILSGVQPSGNLTIGNYLGAISNFVKLQNSLKEGDSLFVFIADLHAITVPQDPTKLRNNIRSLVALYLACGLDPKKTTIFIQSEVKEHAELSYLLETQTYIGELERMTQYKDKMVKQVQGVSTALLTYPVLMASDILLYSTNYVPVGVDQKQHLELARNIAERFNNKYSETFVVPEPLIQPIGSKIMSLQNPNQKMSKSDIVEKASIFMLDDEKVIRKKIMSAVTDSDGIIKYDMENKPGVSNLLTILSCFKNQSMDDTLKEVEGLNYGVLKEKVADAIISVLKPIQERYNNFLNDPIIDSILDEGRDKAERVAYKMVAKVKRKMGLGRKK